mgnify:CR=1 FL=1
MDRLSLLVKARETAEYFVDKKFKYSQGVANSWAGAKKKKVSNCASYVCYCLQQLGILKPGQLFYCNRNGTVVYKGTGTKAAISKRYRLIKVNKLPWDYKNKLKPGDICFYRLHTNIFAFTFHNVSINSSRRTDKRVLRDTHLHSIMYLLIRAIGSKLETDGK